jgi:hypothetical protein
MALLAVCLALSTGALDGRSTPALGGSFVHLGLYLLGGLAVAAVLMRLFFRRDRG